MARSVPIYRSLLYSLLLVVLLLSGAILATTSLGTHATLRDLSRTVIRQTTGEIEAKLRGFFEPAFRGLEIMRAWGGKGLFDLDHADSMRPLLAPLLMQYPQFSSLLVADETGRESMLLRLPDKWLNRQTLPERWGKRSRLLEWTDIEGEPVETFRDLGYDPRKRPWFICAMEGAGATRWTPPYRFFTTKEPGITTSVSFDHGGQRWVVGVDLLLRDLSTFTLKLRASRNGKVVILGQNALLGVPALPEFEDGRARANALLKAPDEVGVPLLSNMAAALRVEGEATRFRSGGNAWWGEIKRFPLSGDSALRIAVLVPEDDLLGDVWRRRIWIVLVTAVVLALGLWRIALLARRYSRPVEALVRETERIGRGDLEAGEGIETRVEEVRRLAQAHERMRDALKTLVKLESDLKIARKIQQDTFPRTLPSLRGFELEAWSEPAEETGGDAYDLVGLRRTGGDTMMVVQEEAEHAVLMLADATGHGVGPALSVTQVRAMLRMAVRAGVRIADIARSMNEQLCADLGADRFITAWLGDLDAETSTLTSFSAGQGPILRYVAADDRFETVMPDMPPFGVVEDLAIEVRDPIPMAPGDLFAVISDGVYEAAGASRELFGEARVRELIRARRDGSPREILDALKTEVERHTDGAPPDDDRTAILIKRT